MAKPGESRRKPDPSKLPPVPPGGVRLLTGGNPQIPKGDGDAPVQTYIAAMPGWKRAVGEKIDHLIVAAAPKVQKAVRWNSPFYGIDGQGWFLNFSCTNRYIKIAFLSGAALSPPPPVASKHEKVRYLHVFEDAPLDAAQFTDWVKQAAAIEGEAMF